MKKKLLLAGAVALMAAAAVTGFSAYNKTNVPDLLSSNVEALAHGENPNCLNGCKANGDGCYCNFYYENYKEATW